MNEIVTPGRRAPARRAGPRLEIAAERPTIDGGADRFGRGADSGDQ